MNSSFACRIQEYSSSYSLLDVAVHLQDLALYFLLQITAFFLHLWVEYDEFVDQCFIQICCQRIIL